MKRSFHDLKDTEFDLLVVGGGIYGAWTAYDAALRGLDVAIIDKNDWASGTSSCSSKLIHGGLRYLEHYWLGLVRKSLKERESLLSTGPHRIRPLRFGIPVYKKGRLTRWPLKAGLLLYDAIAGISTSRSGGFGSSRHQSFQKDAFANEFPFLSDEGMTYGFTYPDSVTDDARYTLEIICGAAKAGAVVLNYAEVKGLLKTGNRIEGAYVEDSLTGDTTEIRAKVTVNTAGPWNVTLPGTDNRISGLTHLTKGVHLTMPALPSDNALLLTSHIDGRVFFLIPWYGRTLLGTTDTDFTATPDGIIIDDKDRDYLLTSVNPFLKNISWDYSDIQASFAGVRSLRREPGRSPSAITREWSLEEPFENFLTPVGGKLTSARAEADQIVSRVLHNLGKTNSGCPTFGKSFPWIENEALENENVFASWENETAALGKKFGFDHEACVSITRRFGSKANDVFSADTSDSHVRANERIHPNFPFCFAEVAHAISHEMATSLIDIYRRRIPLGILDSRTNWKSSIQLFHSLTGRSISDLKRDAARLTNGIF